MMAAPTAELPAADHLDTPMIASCTPIRVILAATDALAGERVVVGGWVRAGRVQCSGTMVFHAISDGSCQASLQLVVEGAQVAHPPLARLGHGDLRGRLCCAPGPALEEQGAHRAERRGRHRGR